MASRASLTVAKRARTASSHGDSAIAGALAYYASTRDHQEYAYTPATVRRSGDESDGYDADEDRPRGRGLGAWFGRARFGRGAY